MRASKNLASVDLAKYPDHALIREADGLTVEEKVLLFTVASHKNGLSYATVYTLRQWTDLSRNKYYEARRSLLEKGLLSEQRSLGGATAYRLRKQALHPLAKRGVEARRLAKAQRAAVATSAPPEPLPTLDTTPAADGQGSSARSGQGTPHRYGHTKTNDKLNNQEIKNMKPSRKVRPPRHMLSSGGVERETMEQKKARLRQRLAQRKERA